MAKHRWKRKSQMTWPISTVAKSVLWGWMFKTDATGFIIESE